MAEDTVTDAELRKGQSVSMSLETKAERSAGEPRAANRSALRRSALRSGAPPLLLTLAATVALSGIGVVLTGDELEQLLVLPPPVRTRPTPGFEPWALTTGIVFTFLFVTPFVSAVLRASGRLQSNRAPLPAFGWAGLAIVALTWIVAWTRLDAFAAIQHHTFIPLWFGYIAVVEALIVRYGGAPTWAVYPERYWLLYVASALYWWSYEWLNRIVENWSYLNVDRFGALHYALFASVAFATVLPAVTATARLLLLLLPLERALRNFVPFPVGRVGRQLVLWSCCAVLTLLPFHPDLLYPLLWLAPLGFLLVVEERFGFTGYLQDIEHGRAHHVTAAALGALVCGFFWEMWNYGSLAHWIYHVPYVSVMHVFEMPLLGFAGYLPFGVLCLAVSRLVLRGDPLDDGSPVTPRPERVPVHLAIIMDGNGRWAVSRRLPRNAGHRAGVERLREVVKECRALGIRYLTVYAFSEENWQRPKEEVELLMSLLGEYLESAKEELRENQVRLRTLGNVSRLPADLQTLLADVEAATSACSGIDLIIALSYGARQEIVRAIRSLLSEGRAPESVDESVVRSALFLPDVPDPDLILRTSGEMRLSNFLLWQAAYAELAFVDTCWPALSAAELRRVIEEFSHRERRYGR